MGSITIIVIWLILSLTIIVSFLALIDLIMQNWLFDLLIDWFNLIADLIWSVNAYILVSLFTLWAMVLVVRFVMSFIWENPGHSANH